ncbi:MAG: PepSY domain-containing protein [Gammaproteobacteria bacterium]
MRFNAYLLIAGGLCLGLLGGMTLAVSQADDMRSSVNLPEGWTMKVADSGNADMIPLSEIVARLERDGSRVTEIELDRDWLRDIYEVEIIDADGKHWDLDIDASTGEVLSKKRDHDWD